MADTLSELTAQNTINSRDIIRRMEELQEEKEALEEAITEAEQEKTEEGAEEEELEEELKSLKSWLADNAEELEELERVNDECSGYGDWEHGETLIAESYFAQYAEQLAEDIGAIDRGLSGKWPYTCIDWDQAAEELKQDYTTIDIEGITFYYRA